MSRDFPTDGEIDAYDRGFPNAKDYWQPIEKDRILGRLREMANNLMFQYGSSYHLFEAIKQLEKEEDAQQSLEH